MDSEALRRILAQVATGEVAIDEAAAVLEAAPIAELGFAAIDHHRALRDGLPEVVLGLGKTPAQAAAVAREILRHAGRVLVTRVDAPQAVALREAIPDIHVDATSRLAWYDPAPRPARGLVAIVTAGTSDIPVAEEAAQTAAMMGARIERIYDVGVAGLHRIARHITTLRKANALVVAAGMEGALPSVVGGMVRNPVIAVPTSVGYGASLGGIAALLAMLNSCATGVAVVNIDNGFGAGYMAASINALAVAAGEKEARND